jgi:hypothetical protein
VTGECGDSGTVGVRFLPPGGWVLGLRFLAPPTASGVRVTRHPGTGAAQQPGGPQSWNRYAYVLNNPLANVDPLGLCAPNDYTCDTGSGAINNSDALNCSVDGVAVSCGDAYGLLNSGAGAQCPNNDCGPILGSNGYLYQITLTTEGWFYINPATGNTFSDGSEYGLPALPDDTPDYSLGGSSPGGVPGSGPGGHTCQQNRILNAIPGATLTSYDVNQGGHEQIGIDTTAADLTDAGFSPFSLFGANGYRNSVVLWSVHCNGQFGSQLGPGGPFTNIQCHIDAFNPATGLFGIFGHGIWDLGVGSLFFKHSSRLDPRC